MGDTPLTDPLGRSVTLHDRTWYGHIVKGHPDMARLRPRVEMAVRRPTAIRLSQADPTCRVYYSQPNAAGTMVVVADIEAGLVKTAYRTRRIKPGAHEWP